MGTGISLIAAFVLTTADFCSDPFDGGVGEPQFCTLTAAQEISTPYFSVIVEPGFIVGVHKQGRRFQAQSTLWGSPNALTVERIEGTDAPLWTDCPEIREAPEDNVTWLDCRISTDGFHQRRLAARLKDGYVLIQYVYTARGASTGPALERMTQSVRVHAI